MIATNYRKFPEAQLLQLELDLAGVVGAGEGQRKAFWQWLANACKAIRLPVFPVPGWAVAVARRARALAQAVKAACQSIFQ